MKYTLRVEYKDGAVIRVLDLNIQQVRSEITVRALDNNANDNIVSWTVYPQGKES